MWDSGRRNEIEHNGDTLAGGAGMATIARNIGASGRRQRLIGGTVMLAVGVAVAVGLQLTGADRGLRLILFLPFAGAAVGLLQARDHT
jgi:hypothetical protein